MSEAPLNTRQICEFIDLLNPSMDDFLYLYDFVNDFYYISPSATKRFLMESHQFHNVSETLVKFVYPEDFQALQDDLDDIVKTDRATHNMVYRWLDHDHKPVWINCCGNIERDADGTPLYMTGCINEIGRRQKADNASGLLGEASLETFLKDYSEQIPKGFILMIGVDDLKKINAQLGVKYGDRVLSKTAEYISANILPGQKLYRVLSDEFLILDFFGGTEEAGKMLYNRVRNAIEQYIESTNYEAVFTISAGLVLCQDVQESSYSSLMKLVEYSLSEAKRRGRNRCHVFSPEEYEKFLRRRALRMQLRRAVNHGFEGFEAYFQPLVHSDTHEIYGAETLMRFHSPESGMVSPAEFIPILEDTGLIIPTGRWILRQALGACKRFQEYIPDFHISINLSPVQILKSYVSNEIISMIQDFHINPSHVTIELTESGFLESDTRFAQTWLELKEANVQLALDDFGSGYSNFRYLTDLDPHIIKIDRTFTAKAMENDYELKLLILFCEMVHSLNLKTCIEGIETEHELDKVAPLSSEYIQGYFFGRPCPYEEFMKLLEQKQPETDL